MATTTGDVTVEPRADEKGLKSHGVYFDIKTFAIVKIWGIEFQSSLWLSTHTDLNFIYTHKHVCVIIS